MFITTLPRTKWSKPYLMFWMRAGTYRISILTIGKLCIYTSLQGYCNHKYQSYSYNSYSAKSICNKCNKVKITKSETIY